MRNVILEPAAYVNARAFLRTTGIVWRDMGPSAMVPVWGESLCSSDVMVGEKTASQVAWQVIASQYPKLKLQWRDEEFRLLDRRPPQLFEGELGGELYYIDIRAAYKNLYKYLYLHSDFPFKRQKYPLYPIARHFEPMGDDGKLPRNCVIGIIRSIRNKWCRGQEVWYRYKYNRFLSPTLWAQICGIMNQIAIQMYEYGAKWINTDGYCFTKETGYKNALTYFDGLGIEVYNNVGFGTINGINSVHIRGVKDTEYNVVSSRVKSLEVPELDYVGYYVKNRMELSK